MVKHYTNMTQPCNMEESVNQLSSTDMGEEKVMLPSNINILNVPATPPPTPTYPIAQSLAERRSTSRMSTGDIGVLNIVGKDRVPDVIDSIGRRRSISCSETITESPKYIVSPFGGTTSIKKSYSFFGNEDGMEEYRQGKCEVNTVTDAKAMTTQPLDPQVKMEDHMQGKCEVNIVTDAKVMTTQPLDLQVKIEEHMQGECEVNIVSDAKVMTTQPLDPQVKMEICPEKDEILLTKTARMVADLDAERYNMEHPRRGCFVILNHDKFDSHGMDRLGSKIDAEELQSAAEFLGFESMICNNLSYQEILDLINKLARMDHTDADCLAVAVLTHGQHNGYLHSKDCLYPVDKLWTPFAANLCPTLAGKPKLFFIQACRGEKLDGGIILRRTETDSGANSYKIPNNADFLISYSTVDGYFSWRNPEDGTWYVRSLCRELKSLVPQGKDFLTILVRVHARVAFEHQSFNEKEPGYHEQKQIPSFVCMLTRELYFTPKKTVQMLTSNEPVS